MPAMSFEQHKNLEHFRNENNLLLIWNKTFQFSFFYYLTLIYLINIVFVLDSICIKNAIDIYFKNALEKYGLTVLNITIYFKLLIIPYFLLHQVYVNIFIVSENSLNFLFCKSNNFLRFDTSIDTQYYNRIAVLKPGVISCRHHRRMSL